MVAGTEAPPSSLLVSMAETSVLAAVVSAKLGHDVRLCAELLIPPIPPEATFGLLLLLPDIM